MGWFLRGANGAVISSRFLQPGDIEEEKGLNPDCDQRFRQQQSMGLPTTSAF
jgi:hypothetical protein